MKKQAKKQLTALITITLFAVGFLFSAPTKVVHAYGHMETVTVTVDISDFHINHVGSENGQRFTSADGKMTFILYYNVQDPNSALRMDSIGEWKEGFMQDISKSGGFYTQAAVTSEGWYDLQVIVTNSGGNQTPPPVVEQPKPEPKPEPMEQPKPTPPPAPKPVETPKPVEQPKPVETPAPVETTAPEEVAVVVEEDVPASDETTAVEDTKIEEEAKKEETPEKTLKGKPAITTAAVALKVTEEAKQEVAKEVESSVTSESEQESTGKEVETAVIEAEEKAGFPWWIFLLVFAVAGVSYGVYQKRTGTEQK